MNTEEAFPTGGEVNEIAKRKDPSQWSEAYRKRIESYERRNPGASRSAAAGKAKKTEPQAAPPKIPKSAKPPKSSRDSKPSTATKPAKTPKAPSGGRRTKDPADWSPAYRKRIENFLKKNPDASLAEARGHKLEDPADDDSELEWTLWSQKRKLGNISLLEALDNMDSEKAREGRQILKAMIRETELMYSVYPAGTTGYYDSQDKLKALYKRLERLGLVNRSGDIVKGDVGYH